MIPASLLAGHTRQQLAAATRSGAELVLAGAGTGKTRTLTLSVAHRILERRIHPWRVLGVTFTSKAAGKMAERVRTAMGGEGVPSWMGTLGSGHSAHFRVQTP